MQSPQTFQSTRPVRGGTRQIVMITSVKNISIHPPRAGRDVFFSINTGLSRNFNPPAPCGAGPASFAISCFMVRFQSTRPVRGGTDCLVKPALPIAISIHPPRAGRDSTSASAAHEAADFNPPAPCGAGQIFQNCLSRKYRFQSTRPVRGGTCAAFASVPSLLNFNPPAPCGAGRKQYAA